MSQRATTIDGYLANVAPDRRATLQSLRATIRSLAPNAAECISYGMPAFREPGGIIAGFAATAAGCSYFPFSGRTLATLAKELSAYSQTKSALHFTGVSPLPLDLVTRLIATRRSELAQVSVHLTEQRKAYGRTSRQRRADLKPHRARGRR